MFSSEEIADVNFHDRAGCCAHGIGNDDGGVRVGASVEHDACVAGGLGDVVRQQGLIIFLNIVNDRMGKLLSKLFQVFFKRQAAIHVNLPGAELAEINSIGNQNVHFVRSIHG